MQRPLPVRIGTLDNFSVADKPDSPTSITDSFNMIAEPASTNPLVRCLKLSKCLKIPDPRETDEDVRDIGLLMSPVLKGCQAGNDQPLTSGFASPVLGFSYPLSAVELAALGPTPNSEDGDAHNCIEEWREVNSPPSGVPRRELSDRERAFLGEWEQEFIEADKLDAILRVQGYMWAARKLVTTLRMNMSFEVDEDGDLLFTSKVPGAKTTLKCVDGARVEISMLGAHMTYDVSWADDGGIVMDLQTHRKGQPTTTARITQRLNPQDGKIY